MANFSQLKKVQVTAENTAEFEIPEVAPNAVLIVRSSNEGNPGYMNGLLRLTGHAKGSRRQKSKDVDAKAMEEMRSHDKELYPEHVIVGWKEVVDATGKVVKYSPAEGASLLDQLPGYVFDELRAFVNDPSNLIKVIDSEAKGKN